MRPPRALVSLRPRELRAHLQELRSQSQQVLGLAIVVGVAVGLGVAGFDWLASEVLLPAVLDLPVGLAAAAPLVGLLVAAALLRWAGRGATPATADEYIRNFHDTTSWLPLRALPARIAAAVGTLGLGGSMGYEGPAIYLGAGVGSAVQRRLSRYFTSAESKVLLVAGAAAGVAAIFKAPVTGIVFALEVPYKDDLARRALLPAAMAAAASYVTFVALVGTEPLLPVAGQPPFDLRDLGGAAVVGLLCGGFARLFVAVMSVAKRLAVSGRPLLRIAAAGTTLALLFVVGHEASGENLTLGPGYDALRWALDSDRTVLAVAGLATLRVAATAATVAGGGVGGLFIPLVVQGALVGRATSGVLDGGNPTLFPVVGIAAFLGAGYRVPLAAVVFVAEFTGRPGFVVPGLIAAVVAQLVAGPRSVSPYQAPGRVGHLERRLRLPLTSVLDASAPTIPPDATVEELFWQHLVAGRRRAVPVVADGSYLGIVSASDVAEVAADAWSTTTVGEIARTDVPAAAPDWLVEEAVRAMDVAAVDELAVCVGTEYVGVIASRDLVALEDVLDTVTRPDTPDDGAPGR